MVGGVEIWQATKLTMDMVLAAIHDRFDLVILILDSHPASSALQVSEFIPADSSAAELRACPLGFLAGFNVQGMDNNSLVLLFLYCRFMSQDSATNKSPAWR